MVLSANRESGFGGWKISEPSRAAAGGLDAKVFVNVENSSILYLLIIKVSRYSLSLPCSDPIICITLLWVFLLSRFLSPLPSLLSPLLITIRLFLHGYQF